MNKVKMTGSPLGAAAAPKAVRASSLSLPGEHEFTIPPTTPEGYALYLYGAEKCGKTSLSMEFEDTFHLFYEPSGKDYRLKARQPDSWVETLGYIDLLIQEKKAGRERFKNVAFDVVDLCLDQCLEHVGKNQGWSYPPQNDFGKGWNAIKEEFRSAIYRLSRHYGTIFLSHAAEREIERADGSSYSMMRPTIMATGHKVLAKFCDLTGYIYIDPQNKRKMRIIPDMHVEAGNRFANHFRYPDGTAISDIEMGKTSKEAYTNFMAAFNNKTPLPQKDETKGTETKTMGRTITKLGGK